MNLVARKNRTQYKTYKMPARTLHLSSILQAFSTFLALRQVDDRDAEAAVIRLMSVLERKKDLSSWTLEEITKLLQKKKRQHTNFDSAETLVMQFVEHFPPFQASTVLHKYLFALQESDCSPATIRNYRSDIGQFFAFHTTTELQQLMTKPKVLEFLVGEKHKDLKISSIRRKLSSITQFAEWLETNDPELRVSKELESLQGELEEVVEKQAANQKPRTTNDTTKNKHWSLPLKEHNAVHKPAGATRSHQDYRARLEAGWRSIGETVQKKTVAKILPYINLATILLFVLGGSYFAYAQFFRDAPTSQAFPETPVRPSRVLSFQGRLTDTAQNPVVTATDFQFKLFDAITSGTELWDSGTCSVDPDQDGIFATGLGDPVTGCGAEISSDVFTENSNIWLEVIVEAETLTPRQQIRTVAYALNSETVQGIPVSATEAATANTLVVLNEGGEVVLGEVSPKIRSTSGTFTIDAQSLILKTSAGSNGDINLSPDGTGQTIVNSNLTTTGYFTAPGATLSATYAGGTALVARGGPSGTANIQEWQNAAGAALSVINAAGNLGVGTTNPTAGALHVVGQCVTGDTKLRRKRKKKRTKSKLSKNDPPCKKCGHAATCDTCEYYELVRIDQIKSGDVIQTLDEKTGAFVDSPVRGLLDMGVQQTYLLITESGKQIRTTKEHPYLTTKSCPRHKMTGRILEVDQSNRIEDLSKDSFIAIAWKDQSLSIKLTKQYKKQLLALYKSKRHPDEKQLKFFAPSLFGQAIVLLLAHKKVIPTGLLIDIEYPGHEGIINEIIKQYNKSIDVHFISIGKQSPAHYVAYGAFLGKQKIDILANKKDRDSFLGNYNVVTPQDKSLTIRNTRDLLDKIYQTPLTMSNDVAWKKVYELKPGMQIATADGWEKIIALKPFALEKTYDIEVENTHNFVGNDIVAHNTYITGNVNLASGSTYKIDGTDVLTGSTLGSGVLASSLTSVGTLTSGTWNASTIGPTYGGTGITSYSTGDLIYASGTNTLAKRAAGTVGQVLTMSGGVPTWAAPGAANSVPWSGLTDPTSNLALSMSTYTTALNWATGTNTDNLFSFTTDASANGTGALVNIQTGTSSTVSPLRVRAGSTEALSVTSGGNVGIGTTSPGGKLALLGAGTTTGFTFRTQDSAGTDRFVIQDNGNVGIGTTAPDELLHISQANGAGDTSLIIQNNATTNGETAELKFRTTTSATDFAKVWAERVDGSNGKLNFGTFGTTFGTRMTIDQSGNVGIGTTGPSEILHISKGATGNSVIEFTRNSENNWIGVGNAGYLQTGIGAGDFGIQAKNSLWFMTNGNNARMVIDKTSGNVGIGTTSPGTKFDVNGATNIRTGADQNFRFQTLGSEQYIASYNDAFNAFVPMQLFASEYNFNAGNVGIGTIGPQSRLHVTQAAGGTGVLSLLKLDPNSATNNDGSAIDFLTSNDGATAGMRIAGVREAAGAYGSLRFYTRQASPSPALYEVMRLDSSGNVGIGTTGPGSLLHVNGSMQVSSVNGIDYNPGSDTNVDLITIGVTGAPTLSWNESGDAFSFNKKILVPNSSSIKSGTSGGSFYLDLGNIYIRNGDSSNSNTNVGLTIGTDKFVVETGATGNSYFNAGNVGIGTTAPGAKLEVAGQVKITGGSPGANKVLTSDAVGLATWTDLSGIGVTSVTGTANQVTASPTTGAVVLSTPTDFRAPGTLNAVTSIATGAGAGTVRIDASGNLTNIGTITSGLINGQTISSAANFTGTATVATSVSSPVFQGSAAAVTFGNASYATTIAGSGLTVSPTAWTATPTISGLITATSGVTANGLVTSNAGIANSTTAITNSAAYTQSGTNANTFTGASSFTATGNALTVTNNAILGSTDIGGGYGSTGVTISSAGNVQANGTATIDGVVTLNNLTASLPVKTNGSKQLVSGAINLASAEVTGILPIANGGTNISTYTTGDLLYASATNTLTKRAIGSSNQVLTVVGGVPTWANPGAAGSVAFTDITTGTNTSATMTVGTGATLTYSGSGVINATQLLGSTWAIPGTIGSTTPNTGAFTTLSSTGASNFATSSGNVGVGTTSADAKLQVNIDTDVGLSSGGSLIVGTTAGSSVRLDGNEIAAFTSGNQTGAILYLQNDAGTVNLGAAALTVANGGNTTVGNDLTISGGDITLGTTSIFSGGDTASLNNIDAIDATTENTFEAAIDSLVNLTTVGTITTGTWNATDISLAAGGTNASLSAVNGGIVYSTGSAMAISAAGGSGECLKSVGAGTPVWGACSTGSVTGSGTTNYLAKWTPSGAVLGDSVIYDNGTNVGIGTTSPEEKLHVEGNIVLGGTNLIFEDSTSGGDASLVRTISFNNNDYLIFDDTANTFSFSADTVDYMTIDDGNVGIGITNPGNDRLSIAYDPVNDSGAYGTLINYNPSQTTTATQYYMAEYIQSKPLLTSGVTASGYMRGHAVSILPITGFDGTLATMDGYFVQAGLYTGATGTITNVYGNHIQMYRGGSGAITNSYGLHIAQAGSGSTVTNDFGVYVASSGLTNYFAGNVGIGTTAPGATLDVSNATPVIRISDTTNSDAWALNTTMGVLEFYTTDTTSPGARVTTSIAQITDWNGSHTVPRGALQFNVSTTASVSEAMRISSGGNVGIGTTNPTKALDVNGQVRVGTLTGTGSNALCYDGSNVLAPCATTSSLTGAGTANYLARWTSATNLGIGATYDNGTNVGIGTTAPGYKFEVNSTAANPAAIITSSISNSSLLIGNTSTGDAVLNLDASNGDGAGSDYFTFRQNNDLTADIFTQASAGILKLGSKGSLATLNIDGGNVGIGTTAPGVKLHVYDTTNLVARVEANSASAFSGVQVQADSASIHLNAQTFGSSVAGTQFGITRAGTTSLFSDGSLLTFGTKTAHDVYIGTNNATNVTIKSGGNVGIGTTGPDTKLHIRDDGTEGAINYALTLQNSTHSVTNNQTGQAIKFRLGSSGETNKWASIGIVKESTYENTSGLFFATDEGNERMRIDNSGNVGIGTTAPGALLDITHPGANTFALIAGADVSGTGRTNATRKFVRVGMPHYTNAEEPIGLLVGDSDGTDNIISLGGYTGYANAATQIRFYTGANNTTTTGTERLRIAADGTVSITGTFDPNGAITLPTTGISGAGTGSGLDADLLDGQHGSYYLNTATAEVKIEDTRADGDVDPNTFNDTKVKFSFTDDITGSPNTWDSVITMKGWADNYRTWQLMSNSSTGGDNTESLYFRTGSATTWGSLREVWDSGNDGAGSGLDADLLDGQHGSYYMTAATDNWVNTTGDTMTGTLNFSNVVTNDITTSSNSHLALMPDGTGNVGIGSTAPGQKLDVTGSIRSSAQFLGYASDTAAAPGLSWDSDTNTGFYRISADNIGVSTAGALEWSFLTGGQFEGNGASTVRTSTGNLTLATNGGNGHIILSPNGTGNVGIGTTGPDTKLHIRDDGTEGAINYALTLQNSTHSVTNNQTGQAIKFRLGSSGETNKWASIGIVKESTYENTSGLFFATDEGNERMRIDNSGNVGIGTSAPAEKLEIVGSLRMEGAAGYGDILFTDGTGYGTNRYSGQISTLAGLKGRLVNFNPDFSQGTIQYARYGANGSIAKVADATSPSSSGSILRVSYAGGGSSPGFGGFYIGVVKCTAEANTDCYSEGNRYVYRIWAKIPVGRSIIFASNAYGTGGSVRWISDTAGTGNWEEYIAVQKIGEGGSFSSTGFFYISGGTDVAFDWDVASVEMIGVDEPATVDLAKSLNIGYKQNITLGNGALLTTGATYLAVDGSNVGIGTTTASGGKLHVVGNIKATTSIDTDTQFLGQASDLVTTPSYSWTSDLTTGFYRPASSQIALTLGGTQRALFTATNVTLTGQTSLTASSLSTLTTSATVAWAGATTLTFTSDNATINGSDVANGNLTLEGTSSGTKTSSNVNIQTTGGNVGIGTTNPQYKLDVLPSSGSGIHAYSSANVAIYGESNTGDGIFGYSPSGKGVYGSTSTGFAGYFTGISYFSTNVGIGSTAPASPLQVVASVNGASNTLNIRNTSTGTSATNWLQMGNDATADAFVVGIRGSLYTSEDSHAFIWNRRNAPIRFGANNTERVRIEAGGNVGIGTTTTTQVLDVNGNARFRAIGSGSYNNLVNMTSDGTLTSSTSDARFKKDITTIDNALDKVLQLRGVTYNWNDPSSPQRMTGMIAQEVLSVMPELVTHNPDGYYGLFYGETSGLLIEAIKEQQGQINTLVTSGELSFSSTGEVVIANQQNNYRVTPTAGGSVITKIAILAEAVIGKLRAGLVTTQDLVVTKSATIADLSVTSLRVGGQTLQAYVEGIVQTALQNNTVTPSQTLVSPVAQIETLTAQTATVSGSTTTQSLTVSGSTRLGSLLADKVETPTLIAGQIEATSARVAALEAGFAQLESIRAQTAEIVDATISGTLYANNIYGFEEKLATSLREPTLLETLIGQQTPTPGTSTAIAAAELAGFQATPSAALQATLAELQLSEGDVVLSSAALFVDQYFSVNGTGYIADSLGIGNKLYVGDGLEFSDGNIAYNPTGVDRPTLYIQPAGNGSLSLLAGLMILSDDGTIAINGDLNVAGTVEADTLLTNLLQPADFGNPFQVQVAGISTESGQVTESRFEIINELGTPVATISAQGKANFSGGIGVGSETKEATTSGEINTEKTSGKATILAGTSELIIRSTVLSADSLIYVTPVGSTGNKVLYVKSQQADQFVVGFDTATTSNVSFNWWVVN